MYIYYNIYEAVNITEKEKSISDTFNKLALDFGFEEKIQFIKTIPDAAFQIARKLTDEELIEYKKVVIKSLEEINSPLKLIDVLEESEVKAYMEQLDGDKIS